MKELYRRKPELLVYIDASVIIKYNQCLDKMLKDIEKEANKSGYNVKFVISKKVIDEVDRNIKDNKNINKNRKYYSYTILTTSGLDYLVLKYNNEGDRVNLVYEFHQNPRKFKVFESSVMIDDQFEMAIGLDEYIDPSDSSHIVCVYYLGKAEGSRRKKKIIPVVITYDNRIVRYNPKINKYVLVISPERLINELKNGKDIETIRKEIIEEKRSDLEEKLQRKSRNNKLWLIE